MEEYQHVGNSAGPARSIKTPDGPKCEQRVTESFSGNGVPGRSECSTFDGSHLRVTETSKVSKYHQQLLGGLPLHIDSGGPNLSMSDGHRMTPGTTPFSVVEKLREGCYGRHNTLNLLDPWTAEGEQAITRPFDYVMSLQGKNVRSQLLSAFNAWLQVDEKSYNIIDKVIGMLHNASLLIDDIQDGSDLRRGSPAAHRVFGTAQTINSANYAYFLAQKELLQLRNPLEAFQIFNDELLNLHRGQGMELFWRDTLTVPTVEHYLQMISNKTGGLFRLAVRLMQSVNPSDHDILPLTELLGLIFQVRDDYRNLCSDEMESTKGFCEDLTEGKFSLPVIHSIRSSTTGNNELLNILKLRTSDRNLKAYALDYMLSRTKSLDYTREVLIHLYQQARTALGHIQGKNVVMEAILDKLMLD
ncbi:hypothetical protein JMJ35_007006 [Cladonia borealis]|uniref:Uncharacterized protein n=1 Tax=Cladonia borealis TaxID=184061 RepID=A0AA39QZ02_9LECA|nr:hypothetical protein JMJ35_007006 [Cladonia borealis]